MTDRTIIRVGGTDARKFLQDLVTNDVDGIDRGLVYAALLTPQGKYLADFFLSADGSDILIDVATSLAPGLMQRLAMYKLRADVTLSEAALHVHRGTGELPPDAHADPRHPALGWRAYRDAPAEETADWTPMRIEHAIPEAGHELTPDSYILELGFERLNGVDFKKGCYVGQEVTARMKHKTELRKGLAQVALGGPVPEGTEITSDGKSVGMLHSVSGTRALAYLRFDRVKGAMEADGQTVTRV